MRKNIMTKTIAFMSASVLMIGTLAGCGNAAAEDTSEAVTSPVIAEAEVAKSDSLPSVPASTEDVNAADPDFVTYEDPNGWSVTYNSADFETIQENNKAAFVYTAESVGTNMIIISYNTDTTAKDAVDLIAESWGNDKTVKTESIFPGAEDTTGYWAMLSPSGEGSGLYEQAVAREYKDGYLLVEIIGHQTGDDELDMAVSDSLAMIIDSITFANA